jgi:hypothetical protein
MSNAADSSEGSETEASVSSGARKRWVGAGTHVVRQGECIYSIAWKAGLSWEVVWNDPANAGLKEAREDPGVLLPGDLVTLPPRTPPQLLDLDVGQTNEFSVQVPEMDLRLVLSDDNGPRSGVRYKLEIDGAVHEASTGRDGKICVPIRPDTRFGKLTLGEGESAEVFRVELGAIDPIDSITGVQSRLANLGYSVGPIDGILGSHTARAIREFQKDAGVTVTGKLDSSTLERLEQAYSGSNGEGERR